MSESGSPSPETVSALLILATVFHALALTLTSFRLWFRYHIRRLWWDDFLAALALLCDAVCMVTMWTLTAPLDNPYINIEALLTPRSYNILLAEYPLLYVFDMVRTMTAFGASGVFVCMWAYMFTCKSVVCSVDNSWYDSLDIRCPMPDWVALSEICTDALSDVILVALPLRLLWGLKLPSNQRIMVLSVFSTSILVSVVSAVHTAYLVSQDIFATGFTAEMRSAISLIVCNLFVIVTFFYRVFRNGRDLAAGLSDKSAGSSNHLTTIDLDFSGGSQITSTTDRALSGTTISTLVFASTSDTTFGSIIPTGGSVFRVATVSTDTNPPSITVE